LYLPVAMSDQLATPAAVAKSDVPSLRRTVLVVEDEAAVRNTLRRQLETSGHRVIVAESADEALQMITGTEGIDVMLTDVVLGGSMDGIDLTNAARRARPDLPVVFISGYTAVTEAQERIRQTGAPLLYKPATLSQLERAITTACASVPQTN
jgi:DNA-binding NtrC family response regulator